MSICSIVVRMLPQLVAAHVNESHYNMGSTRMVGVKLCLQPDELYLLLCHLSGSEKEEDIVTQDMLAPSYLGQNPSGLPTGDTQSQVSASSTARAYFSPQHSIIDHPCCLLSSHAETAQSFAKQSRCTCNHVSTRPIATFGNPRQVPDGLPAVVDSEQTGAGPQSLLLQDNPRADHICLTLQNCCCRGAKGQKTAA